VLSEDGESGALRLFAEIGDGCYAEVLAAEFLGEFSEEGAFAGGMGASDRDSDRPVHHHHRPTSGAATPGRAAASTRLSQLAPLAVSAASRSRQVSWVS
jgi:hypothetical protein